MRNHHHHFPGDDVGRPFRPDRRGPDGLDLPQGRGPGGRRRGRGGRRGGGSAGGPPEPDEYDAPFGADDAEAGWSEPRGRGRGGPERGVGRRGGARRGPGFGPRGFGPEGFGAEGFGPGGSRGPHRRGRGGRARGDVRSAILLLLDEQPRHGYELIQEIAERSAGAWTPSPGSIYPTLQALEDEGLVELDRVAGRKTASLTARGRAHVEERREQMGTPWSTPSGHGHGPALAMRQEAMALRGAIGQMARVGTPAQHDAASKILATARRELYRLLAEDTLDEPSAPGSDGPAADA